MTQSKLISIGSERPLPNKSGRTRSIVRSYLWQIMQAYAARGSMASWGLPFEAIAASMLLRDGRPWAGRKDEEE